MNRAIAVAAIVMLALPHLLFGQQGSRELFPSPPVQWPPPAPDGVQPEGGKPGPCDAAIKQWKDWADKNVPVHEQLLASYNTLSSGYQDLYAQYVELGNEKQSVENHLDSTWQAIVVLGIGLGIGVFAAYFAFKWFVHFWPLSVPRKQLAILVAGAIWISGASLLGLVSQSLSEHPITLVSTIAVASVPAVLFCGIAIWWLNKKMGVNFVDTERFINK